MADQPMKGSRDRVGRYLRDWMRIDLAATPERNPKDLAFAAFLAFSIFPTAVGLERLPGSLARAPFGQFSAATLFAGALVTVAAIMWPNRDSGIAAEFAGSLLSGFGLLFYGVAVWFYSYPQSNGRVVFGICVGLALGCVVRAIQIGLYVRARKRRPEVGAKAT